ncbi:MAG: tetratricopeptide repeat protein [Alkalispirochaetaceae bacterium]
MGSEQPGGIIRVVSAGLVILLLLGGAGSLKAQESPSLELELSDDLLRRGERITLELFVPGLDPDELELLVPALPDRLTLIGEPLLSESRRLVNNSVRSGTLIILQLEAGGAGRVRLPALRVEGAGGDVYLTEERLIEISTDGTREGVPFDLTWRIDESSLLLGETVPVYLEMQNLLDLRYPDSIFVDAPATGLFEEVRGLGSVRSSRVGEATLYDVPVAVFLLTPTEEGTLSLPAAEVSLEGVERASQTLRLPVTPPPQSPDSGGVGSFEFSWNVSEEPGTVIETLTVTLTVRGNGNLPLLSFPDLTLEGLIELDRSEETRQVPTETGYEGERRVTVRLSPGEGDAAGLTIGEFDYFDPDSRRLVELPGESFSFALPGGGEAEPESGARELSLIPAIELVSESLEFNYRDQGNYLLFLIGPGILLVVAVASVLQSRRGAAGAGALLVVLLLASAGVLRGDDSQILRRAERAEELFGEGAYREAADLYRELAEEGLRSGSLYYNLGVSAYYAGSVSETVYGLREAVRRLPGRGEYRELLMEVEEERGLSSQAELPRFVDPEAALIALLVFFNFGLPLVVLVPVAAKGQRVIAVSLFAILLLLGSLTFLQAVRIYEAGRGVVRVEEAHLRRIPEPDADTWLSLSEGTAVHLDLRHQEFILVRTGLGVQGWLSADQLIEAGMED